LFKFLIHANVKKETSYDKFENTQNGVNRTRSSKDRQWNGKKKTKDENNG
jgi:hypothetical protein